MTSIGYIPLRKAALISGIGYLVMIASPIAEAMFHHFADLSNATATVRNITNNAPLVRYTIILYLINFVGDVLAAWGLYLLFRPVSRDLSLFTAWLRIIYTVMSLVAVMNLLTVLQLTSKYNNYLKAFTDQQLQAEVMSALHSFRDDWSFAFSFFGIHLMVLGYLAIVSTYVSKIVGACLVLAGAGWLTDSLQPFLYANMTLPVGMITGFGELVFTFWLFIKGMKLQEQ